MKKPMTPDEVCGHYADLKIKITSRLLDDFVLIEGRREALEFLGHLLISQANDARSCKKFIAPDGAGNTLFTSSSNLGFYIHRLPCDEGSVNERPANEGDGG